MRDDCGMVEAVRGPRVSNETPGCSTVTLGEGMARILVRPDHPVTESYRTAPVTRNMP